VERGVLSDLAVEHVSVVLLQHHIDRRWSVGCVGCHEQLRYVPTASVESINGVCEMALARLMLVLTLMGDLAHHRHVL
jgi:hypothetical protein